MTVTGQVPTPPGPLPEEEHVEAPVRSRRRRLRAPALPSRLVAPLIAVLLALELLAQGAVQILSSRGGYDAAYFAQATHLIAHGDRPFVTIRGLHILGDHFSPVIYPLAVPTVLISPRWWLMIVQAVALAVAILPLAAICRRHAGLGPATTTGLLVAYALFPAMHNVNASSFHPEALAVPALLGAVLFALERRWLPYGLCVALVLSCREDIALTVAGLGVLVAVTIAGRAGWITAGVALLVFVLDVAVLMPHFAGGAFIQAGQLSRYGPDLGSQVGFVLAHPRTVLGDLLTTQNLTFVVQFLGPLLFLPLAGLRWLAPMIPLQLLYLLSDRKTAHTILAQYTAHAIPFALVAAAFGLAAIIRSEATPRVARGLVAVGVVAWIATAKDSPGYVSHPWALPDRVDQARHRAAALVPADVPVVASERMLPLLAERRDVYTFPGVLRRGLARWPGDRLSPAQRAAATDWIVVDTADGTQWNGDAGKALPVVTERDGFRQVFGEDGILVFSRSAGG